LRPEEKRRESARGGAREEKADFGSLVVGVEEEKKMEKEFS